MSEVPPMKGPHMLLVSFLLVTVAEGYRDALLCHADWRQERRLRPGLWRAAVVRACPASAGLLVFHWGAAPSPLSVSAGPGQTRRSVPADVVVSSSGVS